MAILRAGSYTGSIISPTSRSTTPGYGELDMRTVFAAAAVLALWGVHACKTTDRSVGSDADVTPLSETKAALKDSGCLGCHADTGESEWRMWAAATKDTAGRLTTSESDPAFDPVKFEAKGVYKAFPEYFKKYFTEDDQYETFVDGFRPDPGMRVRGSGDIQRDRFTNLLNKMLTLANDAVAVPPADPGH